MPIVSFSVFKEKIIAGLEGKQPPEAKKQTIRKRRKYPIKKGDRLYLWWKSRTPQREKLGEPVCSNEFLLRMELRFDSVHSIPVLTMAAVGKTPYGTDCFLFFSQRREIAVLDGFSDASEMAWWFWREYGEFNEVFQVIRWEPAQEVSC